MAKKQTEKRSGPGRPSTFPEGTSLVAMPTRVPVETRDRLRWLAENRKSPFGLSHNSIGAEIARLVDAAYNAANRKRKPAASKTDA